MVTWTQGNQSCLTTRNWIKRVVDAAEYKFQAPVSEQRETVCESPCYLNSLTVNGEGKLSAADHADPLAACKTEQKQPANRNTKRFLRNGV